LLLRVGLVVLEDTNLDFLLALFEVEDDTLAPTRMKSVPQFVQTLLSSLILEVARL